MSPSRSPPPDLGRPSPPPPAVDTKREHASKNAPSMISKRRSSPKRKLSPLPKAPHANLPIRPYDRTAEENTRIAKEHHDAQMKKKEPEPRPEYTEKQIAYAKYFTKLPSQYDYTRTLQKEGKKSRSRASASGSKSSSTTSKKRPDVPQLGQQAKQSIPPLRVLPENVPPLVQGKDLELAKKWADEWGIPVEDVLASQDDRLPKAVVAPKPQFVMAAPLVSKDDLPTNMRYLHTWYLSESKNGRTMIVVSVPREYYGRPEEIHIDFDELFQMYNGDALEKSLMSSYCLMKILECKSRNILNIGFIDPDKIHIATLTDKPKETEENLLRVWKRFKCVTPGIEPEKLTFRAAQYTAMSEKSLPEQRAIAVAEELATFLRTEAIDDKGRFSVARGHY
ncbi:hypothetical protein ZWY2020_007877 [Hordeum vulgare]|nr:hypothetical protein ZWY2020_007877 [Hordeum vulgare]